ncbi:hypothetical protein Agub_g9500, partial [Astrephomene gubernaculifera]
QRDRANRGAAPGLRAGAAAVALAAVASAAVDAVTAAVDEGCSSEEDVKGKEEEEEEQQQEQRSRPLSFWEWLGGRPELWVDPLASRVMGGLQHWDNTGGSSTAGAGAAAENTSNWRSHASFRTSSNSTRGISTSSSSSSMSSSKRVVPLCFGPLELATIVWAAARLQLHRAVPEHFPWLLHDIMYGSYNQMSYFDGRQLAQLSYSLAQLGPAAVPPARWGARFLAAAGERMGEMDSQSLANLAHSLEPLNLRPDPAWLRHLLAASGTRMLQPGAGAGTGPAAGARMLKPG